VSRQEREPREIGRLGSIETDLIDLAEQTSRHQHHLIRTIAALVEREGTLMTSVLCEEVAQAREALRLTDATLAKLEQRLAALDTLAPTAVRRAGAP